MVRLLYDPILWRFAPWVVWNMWKWILFDDENCLEWTDVRDKLRLICVCSSAQCNLVLCWLEENVLPMNAARDSALNFDVASLRCVAYIWHNAELLNSAKICGASLNS